MIISYCKDCTAINVIIVTIMKWNSTIFNGPSPVLLSILRSALVMSVYCVVLSQAMFTQQPPEPGQGPTGAWAGILQLIRSAR